MITEFYSLSEQEVKELTDQEYCELLKSIQFSIDEICKMIDAISNITMSKVREENPDLKRLKEIEFKNFLKSINATVEGLKGEIKDLRREIQMLAIEAVTLSEGTKMFKLMKQCSHPFEVHEARDCLRQELLTAASQKIQHIVSARHSS